MPAYYEVVEVKLRSLAELTLFLHVVQLEEFVNEVLNFYKSCLHWFSPVRDVEVGSGTGPELFLTVLFSRVVSSAVEVTHRKHDVTMAGQVSQGLTVRGA